MVTGIPQVEKLLHRNATEVQNRWGDLVREVRASGSVAATHHDRIEMVGVAVGKYREMAALVENINGRRQAALAELTAEFDRHLESLNAPDARKRAPRQRWHRRACYATSKSREIVLKRPIILVLAGVNRAGKSSVGGDMLKAHGLNWVNPDTFSRQLIARSGLSKQAADADTWAYGKAKREAAITSRTSFAFETTLGGNTIPRLLGDAANTYDVMMKFCGLASVQLQPDRIKDPGPAERPPHPERDDQKAMGSSRQNLIALLPRLAHLQLFDTSVKAAPGEDVPYAVLLLAMRRGRRDVDALEGTPDWANPIVAAAFRRRRGKDRTSS